MRGQKMTLQPDKHNWGFHPQTPKVYRFWVSGKGDTTSSDAIFATESIGRQFWPGLARIYGPAGRGKRLYADIELLATIASYHTVPQYAKYNEIPVPAGADTGMFYG